MGVNVDDVSIDLEENQQHQQRPSIDPIEQEIPINDATLIVEPQDISILVDEGEPYSNDNDDAMNTESSASSNRSVLISRFRSNLSSFLFSNLLPDHYLRYALGGRPHHRHRHQLIGRIVLFETTGIIRCLKFVILVVCGIIFMKKIITNLFPSWQRDEAYNLREFFLFDFASVVQDCIVFAVVGRIHRKRGMDRLWPCILPIMASCLLGSWMGEVEWMKSSITLYNMACGVWSWKLYVFASMCIVIVAIVFGLHFKCSIRDGSYMFRSMELFIAVVVCILPLLVVQIQEVGNSQSSNRPTTHTRSSSHYFHLHHYYSFWLMGMFFNRNEWWSEIAQAVAIGQYMNGIACWGRDSVLTCLYAAHIARGNRCGVYSSDTSGIMSGNGLDMGMDMTIDGCDTTMNYTDVGDSNRLLEHLSDNHHHDYVEYLDW
eukprot:CAMPEP_0194104496 /NCGR_PEP_ID=MMETSP0150-20130528/4835_1 /TAXON_ID=122233 /ORGANISM="Chaetoceros debilis, Strain MM31A-1" /LENGTH=430 /DNA_ID=CAMNT_0038792047 /DNA_START=282 /DNA_END=1571 /DNA_ORIENTATION=+